MLCFKVFSKIKPPSPLHEPQASDQLMLISEINTDLFHGNLEYLVSSPAS